MKILTAPNEHDDVFSQIGEALLCGDIETWREANLNHDPATGEPITSPHWFVEKFREDGWRRRLEFRNQLAGMGLHIQEDEWIEAPDEGFARHDLVAWVESQAGMERRLEACGFTLGDLLAAA